MNKEKMDELEKLKRELAIAGKAADIMIAKMNNLLAEALNHNNWSRAGELESYVSGCKQIKTVYEIAIKIAETKEE